MAIGFLVNISQRGDVSYNRIQTLLSISSEVIETDQPLPAPSNGELVYEISEFAYDNIPVLQDIQFQIKKGRQLVLWG